MVVLADAIWRITKSPMSGITQTENAYEGDRPNARYRRPTKKPLYIITRGNPLTRVRLARTRVPTTAPTPIPP